MSVALLPLKIILLTIDFVLAIITFQWVGVIKKLLTPKSLRSVPVDGDEATRQCVLVQKTNGGAVLTTPSGLPNVQTLYDLSNAACTKYAEHKAMGSRIFLKQQSKTVKEFSMDIKWRTYNDVGKQSLAFGAGLKDIGLVASPEVATLDKITKPCSLAIFENSCAEWMISSLGAFSQSIIVTTIYATLGIDAVVDAINDGSISAIVCNRINVQTLVDKLPKMKSLKTIIYTNDLVPTQDDNGNAIKLGPVDVKGLPKGVTVVAFDDFVKKGETLVEKYPPVPPKPDSCAVIMYTSGSTGKPKGVVIKHSSVIATIAGLEPLLGYTPGEDVYIAYLPLAHIFELAAEYAQIGAGCCLCYADPKTLTTKGSYPIGALEHFKPTLMCAVPKIWDVIKKGVEAKVAASSTVAKFLVKTAFEARAFAMSMGYDTPLFKALVFKKFSAVVGGRLKTAISGGGPLNAEVQNFIKTCFGCPLVQGYGLTETCSGGTVQAFDDDRGGIAGVPIPSCNIRLKSTPDIPDKAGVPYMSTDRRDVDGNPIFGRGEVLIQGGNTALGYYMMPDKTAEVFNKDGSTWFETGDIGQFMDDGSLKIIDRKKNLVKLKGGEYIALEMMEMSYGNSSFVDAIGGGICCYGDGDMDRPVALMQLNEPVVMAWAKENGVEGTYDKIKNSKEVYDAVMADLKLEHKKAGLSHLEKLVAVTFMPEPWTPENGCLTAANKLQRRAVVEMFSKEFEDVKKKGVF